MVGVVVSAFFMLYTLAIVQSIAEKEQPELKQQQADLKQQEQVMLQVELQRQHTDLLVRQIQLQREQAKQKEIIEEISQGMMKLGPVHRGRA